MRRQFPDDGVFGLPPFESCGGQAVRSRNNDLFEVDRLSISPFAWVPSPYFAMGFPFVVPNMFSAVMFKALGLSDERIAFGKSLVMWPWTVKFLWNPFLELCRTEKFWVVATQRASGRCSGARRLHGRTLDARTGPVYRLAGCIL